ncbi:SusD/RagB family nutrient-binding outer membrane lipoprotein [Hymenobacter lapidiphilus]|uniref:SusD/RagB family nutrient-binding outer membrane lipoprotein n=1 Tax=Hymenobacter sp. CCM 8763 TaxID=2303334 RepID=UPI000E3429B3|nr:SusD/RagB family nutrient-binding outer membrane lipoprotein [Hymenobacter sp. CCM 8763]RFP65543.1 SusD/RagB family nutrient-binding outer membrane lipoprotein [Hymenobacter sp. CCM 8763]
MKKILLAGVSALALTASCVGSLDDDYNVDPKSPTTAPAAGFIANAERSLTRAVVSPNVNSNPLRYFTQYWAATDYPTEARYDLNTRNIPTNFWNSLYRDCIQDLRAAKTAIPNDITIPEANKANALAVAEVLEIYAWATLVETYGNIPYSEALDFNKPRPKYDDQTTIYNDLISRLDVVIRALDTNASVSTGLGTNDLINGGSTVLWTKFAYAMKLRMALVIADVDNTKAKAMAESTVASAGKLLASNADNIDLTFNGTFPNTNPLFEDLVRSGRQDFVGANYFIDRLKGVAGPVKAVDPRLNDYFNAATSASLPAGSFVGGVVGTTNPKTTISQPGTKLRAQTLPGVLMSYAQVEFLLAEARSRGYAVGGTAESHYNAGVTASILEWGGTAAEATAYLANPTVAYTTAPGTEKQKIAYQEWVALYNQPVESWTTWRRLDYPNLPIAVQAVTDVIPVRYVYPVVEQNINGANYSEAAAAIGGDKVGTKLFWDKF